MWTFLLASILVVYITNASDIDTGEIQALNFLLVGDWGKGGNSGYISNRISDNDEVNDDDNDDDDNNKSKIKHQLLVQGDTQRKTSIQRGGENRALKQSTNQAAIAKAMGSYSDSFKPSFIIALGDNFYANGVSSSTDSYWDYLWVNVYLDYYPSLRVSWYPVFGNHDYGYGDQGVQAQLDRTLIDEYWSFPATNYTKTFNIPEGGTVTVVFIDTTILAPSENKCCNSNGGISTTVQSTRITNQLRHINQMLREARRTNTTWLLVAGHYPVYSKGENGDTSELQTYLVPLLEKYNVHAYFCGHDHLSEHIKSNGVHYFVNGGGSMTDTVATSSNGNLLWAGEGYSAFASASATKTDLTISYVNAYKAVQYSYTLTDPFYTPDNPPAPSPTSLPILLKPELRNTAYKTALIFYTGGVVFLAFMMMLGGATFRRFGRKTCLPKKKSNTLSLKTQSHKTSTSTFTVKKRFSKIKKKALKLLRSDRKSKFIPGDTSSTPLNSSFSYSKLKQLNKYKRDHPQANCTIPDDATSTPVKSIFSYSKIEDTLKQLKNTCLR